MKKYLTPIIFGVIVLAIVVFAIIALRSPDKSQSQTDSTGAVTGSQLTELQTGHDQGPADAKVVLVEFGDYQCPSCGAAYPVLKNEILPQFNNKIRFVFKNFPLTQIHKNAMAGANAAEAAGAQGKYWEMHDALYEHQTEWSTASDPTPFFAQYASNLGLDSNRLVSEVKAQKYKDVIQKDMDLGNDLKVQGTPTFYVNGTLVDTSQGLTGITTAINAALAQ